MRIRFKKGWELLAYFLMFTISLAALFIGASSNPGRDFWSWISLKFVTCQFLVISLIWIIEDCIYLEPIEKKP